jgi:hypothetical protein
MVTQRALAACKKIEFISFTRVFVNSKTLVNIKAKLNKKVRTKPYTNKQSEIVSCIDKVYSKPTLFLLEAPKNLHTSFAAMAHLAEGIRLNAMLMLKVENFLIYLGGT